VNTVPQSNLKALIQYHSHFSIRAFKLLKATKDSDFFPKKKNSDFFLEKILIFVLKKA